MWKLVIVVGDTTTHGGKVVGGSNCDFIDDLEMVHVGAGVICPEHGYTTVTTGQINGLILDGRLQAAEGDLTSCGASLISIMQNDTFIEASDDAITWPSMSEVGRAETAGASVASASAGAPTSHSPGGSAAVCDERFKLVDSGMEDCGRLNYALLHDNNYLARAVLDGQGRSRSHGTDSPVDLHLAFQAPSPAAE